MDLTLKPMDQLLEALGTWCAGTGYVTVSLHSQGWTAILSRYKRHVRLYLNTDGGCIQYPFDLDQPSAKWRGPLATMLEWAQNKDDEDAA